MSRALIILRTVADRAKASACKVSGCSKSADWADRGREGYCAIHHYRWKRHGDPLAGRTPPGEPMAYLCEVMSDPKAFSGDECLIWPYARNSAGYGHLSVDGKNKLAHRLVCEAVHGEPTGGKNVAAHSCGNGHLGCFNPAHVRWDTTSGNAKDMADHGTSQRGERMHMSKLTNEAVKEIRASALSIKDLAEKYNVTRSNISYVINHKTWRHV